MSDPARISGSVERITFYNEENGYAVIRLKPDRREMLPYQYASGREALITVTGHLPDINAGEWLEIDGRWETHAKHGRQFRAEKTRQALPATTEGIKRYLGSGLIKGVGKVMAERIVNQFGADTLDVIEQEPQRLADVIGIGRKRIDGIIKAWEEQQAIKEVMLFLQSHAVSTTLATKIYKKYGDDSLGVVRKTPYQMVQDIRGVGFKTADTIAQAIGLAHDDPGRIEAGIAFTLNQKTQEGHVYVPQDELEPQAAEILGVAEEQVSYVIQALAGEELIKIDDRPQTSDYRPTPTTQHPTPNTQHPTPNTQHPTPNTQHPTPNTQHPTPNTQHPSPAVYLTPMYYAEVGVTNRIRRMVESGTSRVRHGQRHPQGRLPLTARPGGPNLSSEQTMAVETALENKVTVLTGGPGTGKTTTLRALLDELDSRGNTYALASPTGRAAKRLSEATGRPAKTIHRLLEFKPGEGFTRDEDNPLAADMIVIDETSMLDMVLANSLLRAIDPACHVLFVGDIDQLPSVGAGDVLRDLIDSGVPALVRLRTIFRQAADSLIVHNAHRINRGEMPETLPHGKDFFIFVKEEPQELAELIVDIVKTRVPAKFGLNPFDDVQVLSPMYQGAAGVSNLNFLLQKALNPPGRKAERRLGGRVFRVGDKVLQTVNNYDKNVFNGDIGRVTAIDQVNQTISINMDGQPVVYDFLEVDELVHAYAISVHKSQGSEYPCVVIPVTTQHYMMLQRNLLYTGVTRGKRLVILAGTRRAIAIAVKNNKVAQRYTGLAERLKQ
ncbi:MAG: ATP-dependent RecD-like DNA helicase [Ardenticatenaceae bacterium]|nr:ATP-dependent RecD-like DNA helicase [Ardenticatenaceae bacterium]